MIDKSDKKNRFASLDHRQLIRKQAAKLAELLRQSPEYSQFVAARSKLAEDDEHSEILAELRQQQMTLRMANLLGEDIEEECSEFESMFVLLSQEPVISDYLFAEGRFFRLISDVEEVFSDKLELWSMQEDEVEPGAGYDIRLN